MPHVNITSQGKFSFRERARAVSLCAGKPGFLVRPCNQRSVRTNKGLSVPPKSPSVIPQVRPYYRRSVRVYRRSVHATKDPSVLLRIRLCCKRSVRPAVIPEVVSIPPNDSPFVRRILKKWVCLSVRWSVRHTRKSISMLNRIAKRT